MYACAPRRNLGALATICSQPLRLARTLVLLALTFAGAAALGAAPKPVIERAKGGECVAAPEVMRREHMRMLDHQRDDTVLRGVREVPGKKLASLQGCVDCHASAKTGSVASAPEDFCVSCHRYTAVKIDCFECHATRPRAAAQAGGPK